MASTARARLIALSIGTVLAAAVGWAVWDRFGGRGQGVALVDGKADVAELLANRDPTPISVDGLGPFVLEKMDAATVDKMAIVRHNNCEYDEECYYRYKPGIVHERPWLEHPDGRWVRTTNSAGFREDAGVDFGRADLDILVTGDSHTDGLCNNDETFTHLLQERLAKRWSPQTVEAINTGVVGYSFYNYLGVLRKHLAAQPDVCVVAVYGGNDFYGTLRYHHWYRGTQAPASRPSFWERMDAAKKVSHVYVAQSLNQALYFQEHPEEIDVAYEGAVACTREIRRLCHAAGVRLVFVYIPPAYEASWPGLDVLTAQARDTLDLSDTDLAVARRIADRYLAELARLEIDFIDAGPLFRARTERCYWETDLHINLLGHTVIAEALDAHLASGGGELGAAGAVAVPDGPYVERDAAGVELVRGTIADGLRSGEWSVFFPNGALSSRGSWRAGRRDGDWAWWYEDGAPKKAGAYEHERPIGPWKEWYKDGTPRLEGAYSAGAPSGPWREWHSTGALASEGEHGPDGRTGTWRTWYADGQRKSLLTFRAGAFDGSAESWHPGEVTSMRGAYVGGEREGLWEFWSASGVPLARGAFRAGVREGPWTFWMPSGAPDPARSGLYANGERIAAHEDE